MVHHYAAHLVAPLDDLCAAPGARVLWAALREAFPSALAAVLMPTHLQFLDAGTDVDGALRQLRRALAEWTRTTPFEHPWMTVKPPTPVRDVEKLRTGVR